MNWALSLFAAGIGVIGLISFRRRPQPFATLCFMALILMVFGVLSLGMTGSGLERLFRPLIKLVGLFPSSPDSLWRIAMFLSLIGPLGLVIAYWLRRSNKVVFIISFIVYCFVCDVLAHLLVRAV